MQHNPAKPEFQGPEGILKLCPLETAKRIWKEKSAEVLCSKPKDLGERYNVDYSQVHWHFLIANFLEKFWKIILLLPLRKEFLSVRIPAYV